MRNVNALRSQAKLFRRPQELLDPQGKLVGCGRTLLTAEGTPTDGGGKLLAHGASTLMVLRQEKTQ